MGFPASGPGVGRPDCLQPNDAIFALQSKAFNGNAIKAVKALVEPKPANTDTLIVMKNVPGLNPRNFIAMIRLAHS